MTGLGLHIGLSITGSGGSASVPQLLAFATPLIVIGPSIQNVTNTRAPRHWLMGHSQAHFYPTPGTNQATGGGCATAEGATANGSANNYYEEPTIRIPMVMNQLGDNSVRGQCLVFYDPGPNDLADFSTSLVGANGLTPQKLIDAADRWVARVTAAGHMIALAGIYSSNAIATNTYRRQAADLYNAHIATLHDPASGVFYCGSRLSVITDANYATYTYDGLHPTASGADLVGYADYTDLAPYFDVGSAVYTATTYPYGQSGNTLWNMPGTGGTASTGTTGSVATGWTAVCSTSGTGVGSSIGITATMSKGTRDFTVNGTTYTLPCQIVDITGTPSADGFFRFESTSGVTMGSGGAANYNWCEYGQASLAVFIGGSTVTDPVGVASMGFQNGLMGAMMSKTVEANAGYIARARQLVFRNTPVQSLKLNGAQKPEFALGFKSGVAVDVKLYLACLGAQRVEQSAYASLYNLSQAFVSSGGTNPLTRRPDLTGTKTVGSTLTLNPPCISGGGSGLYGNSYIKDSLNNTIATFANTANPSTYVLQAGDSGKTIRMTADVSNSYGSTTIDDGPTYAIP